MENLCKACQLRSKNEFSIVSRMILNIFLENSSSSDTFTCQCCLGLLQPSIAKQFLQTATKCWEEENYDSRSFNLCISFPLSVMIRDKILQLLVQNDNEITFSTLKDVCKFCYRNQLESIIGLEGDSGSDFSINLNFKQIDLDGKDTEQIKELFELECKSKKRKTIDDSTVSRVVLIKNLDGIDEITIKRLFKDYAYFHGEIITPCELNVHFERLPLFIGGRYMKFSRYVHQTPWVVDGEKRSKNSVQEVIDQHFLTDILCDETKFTASGREDVDVRMLGNGRPFALQFLNPRRKLNLNLDDYASKINFSNQDVRVDRLKIVSQKDFDVLNKSEESKIKNYVALCYFYDGKFSSESKLPEMKFLPKIEFPLEIIQKTPIRVLHRRPLIDRKRNIYKMNIFPVDDVHFQLSIATEAGTYIKEFVHGDFGRTRPSLGDLLGYKVDILELDVEKVDFNWP